MLLSLLATASALPWPQGDVQQDVWAIRFLIRHDESGVQPATLLSELGATDVGEARPEAGIEHQVSWARPPAASYALDMDLQDVWGSDYSTKGRELIAGKKVVDVLLLRMRSADRNASFKRSLDLVARYAKRVDGFVEDAAMREIFLPSDFERKRVTEGWLADGTPDVMSHVQQHAYIEPDGLARTVTLGMQALGLPEVVVDDAAPSNLALLGGTVNLVAQVLVQNSVLPVDQRMPVTLPSGEQTTIHAIAVAPHPGDQGPWLIGLDFAEQSGTTAAERQASWLRDRLRPDRVERNAVDLRQTPEARATQASLPKLRKRFAKGLAPGDVLMVKAPFSKDPYREWMWVEVSTFGEQTLKGLLMSHPRQVPLRQGQPVEVQVADIVAWGIMDLHGTVTDSVGIPAEQLQ